MKSHGDMWLFTAVGTCCSLILLSTNAVADWAPITGIPEPTFGIHETAPQHPDNWLTPAEGFYFVEQSSAVATDTENPFGTKLLPRLTIPGQIPSGSVVELKGEYDSPITLDIDGSKQKPTFIRGSSTTDRPTIMNRINIHNSFVIVENIKTQPTPTGKSGIQISEGANFVVVRNSELSGEGNLTRTGGLGIGSWGYSGINVADNIILDNLYVHDIGDFNATFDQDAHGITINGNATNVWITNSEFTRTSGDGVQIEAQHNRGSDQIHHVYFGANISHQNKQTGFWVKHARDIIISGNHFYDFSPSNSSDGTCTGFQYSAQYLWFINNKIHNCSKGIGNGSDDSGDSSEAADVYYVGNIIHDISATNSGNPHTTGGGLVIRMGYAKHHIVNNTIDGSESGISAPINAGALTIVNNIITGRSGSSGWDIYLERASVNSGIDNNLFLANNGVTIFWNANYSSLDSFNSATGLCDKCIAQDPDYIDKPSRDYHLRNNSPATDLGTVSNVYSVFQARYGLSIDSDINGNGGRSRLPVSLGAYQKASVSPLPPVIIQSDQ